MQRADAGVTALIPVAPGPPPPSISAAHNCNLSGGGWGGERENQPAFLIIYIHVSSPWLRALEAPLIRLPIQSGQQESSV